MPHEIDQTTGQAAVFVAGEPPWHGLGTVVQQAATGSEALKLAHLDWPVEQWPLQAVHGDGRGLLSNVVDGGNQAADFLTPSS